MTLARSTAALNVRDAERMNPQVPRTLARLPSPRAFWLAQSRFWLQQARMWRALFGGDDHAEVLGWFLHALLEADRYRRWARELAPALRELGSRA